MVDDAERISCLAGRIWRQCYSEIISQSQIDYMLEQRFERNRLESELAGDERRYWLVEKCGETVAYGVLSLLLNAKKVKIEQIYVDASVQRMGIGRALLDVLLAEAMLLGGTCVWLTVNRFNKTAIDFYLRSGFLNAGTKVTSIGNGFVMDDFVMEKELNSQK